MIVKSVDDKLIQVNQKDEVVGPVTRKQILEGKGELHRAVGVLVMDKQGRLLMQKRSLKKEICPGCWGLSAAGHVNWGEKYLEAANRQLAEELGLKGKLMAMYKFCKNDPEDREFVKIYNLETDSVEIEFDMEELDTVMWVKQKQVDTFVRCNKMTGFALEVLHKLQYI